MLVLIKYVKFVSINFILRIKNYKFVPVSEERMISKFISKYFTYGLMSVWRA